MAYSSLARVTEQPTSVAPIDLVQLATSTLGNRDLELQVLRMFKSQSATILAKLGSEQDGGQRRDLVHTLKGSARAIGALRVAAECERVEGEMDAKGEAPMDGLEEVVGEANGYIGDLLRG